MTTRWLLVVLALVCGARSLSAQDVEMLGRRYGTTPPPGYFQEMARNPNAYRFTRGRAAPERMVARARALVGSAGVAALGAPAAVGPRAVTGTFRIPVVLGLFSDTPAPAHSRAAVQQTYFDAPSGTVTAYYDEVSRGAVTLLGDTQDWQRASATQATTTQNQSALVCCGIGGFIKQILDLQTGVNWGLYDNDGPDNVPNSGDDDGFVDALAVIHPTQGAECGGSGSSGRVWSHKWALSFASGSGPYTTTSPRFGGGFIRIDDYFVQGVLKCDQSALNEIGVFTHEAGHAFGLPDLYDTRGSGARHNGSGNWDLMGTGSYGCNGATTFRPCHMGAWSKSMLGWVDVVTLPAGTDLGTLTLPPVETSGDVYRVQAGDGSAEYFLLENRQAIGFDEGVFDEGLLVWQIDSNVLLSRWASNTVNASDHMAVWLRQADGCDDLGRTGAAPPGCDAVGLRGDAGDPFPGALGNIVFHAASNPASRSYPGTATGLTLLDITEVGADDIQFRALTRFTALTVSSTGTTPGATGIFTIDGVELPPPPANVVLAAPYAPKTIAASGGEVTQPGERLSFVQWTDDAGAPRSRTVVTPLVDTEYTATYSGIEYQLNVGLTGGINGVAPGTIQTTPASADLWFSGSTAVQVNAVAQTGFAFLGWSGALAGQPNPAAVVMNGPVTAGATFQLVYDVDDVQLTLIASEPQDVQLETESGTAPVAWQVTWGALPVGLTLSSSGRMTGAPLDVGSYPVTVQASDALGLTATGTLTLDVGEPVLAVDALASTFLLGGPALTAIQEAFLDRQGNSSGAFDLGDFRAWVLAHPSLPLSAALRAASAPATVRVPMRLGVGGAQP